MTHYVFNDGGRKAAGFKGSAGDCVTRAVAIISEKPYQEVYDTLALGMKTQRATKRMGKQPKSARNGVSTKRKWFKDYMDQLGFEWVPTMLVGQGCKVHLSASELPSGRIIVALAGHYTAMIDGVIHDTYNPQRQYWTDEETEDGSRGVRDARCVYGYWKQKGA